jgi:predicted nucleotidyltransferase
MFTRRALDSYVAEFLQELKLVGIEPQKAILFGSYVNGNPKEHSDIDLAVWAKDFSGCTTKDIEPIAALVSKYYHIELHTFAANESKADNPFIEVIERSGRVVLN